MAVFFTNDPAGGSVIYRPEQELALNPVPASAPYRRAFDEATNAGLVSAWRQDSQAFSMPGGTVTQGGVPVTFNPDGAYFAARRRAAALLVKIKSTGDPITREEIADVAAIAFHADGLPST